MLQLDRKKPQAPKSQIEEPQVPYQNLSTPQALGELNVHLQSLSYIEGYSPSWVDLAVHAKVPQPVLSSYPHVSRWYGHISAIKGSIQV